MKRRLMVSFSGGKTSAYMAKKLKDEFSGEYEMVFVFANTGEEWEETLRFADRCDREWGLGLVWVEAVVHDERKATTHRIVEFSSASRNGEPFEAIIKKYGIPNKAFPHCTRELKLNPIRSYLGAIGWADCLRAVGIRADEPERIRKDAAAANIVYPLASMFPATKPMVNDWWAEQAFTLNLQEHQGNCRWCWKKSLKKHIRIAQESPEAFAFPRRMEATYPLAGTNPLGIPRTFFREHRSTNDIVSIAALVGKEAETSLPLFNNEDDDGGCSESCEAFIEGEG